MSPPKSMGGAGSPHEPPKSQPPSGDRGMRVSPRTSGMFIATSSIKHHDQASPGSIERMIG